MGLWFLSSVFPFINIYVCTKFNFNPFSTRISNHYEKNGYGEIQGRVGLWFLCTFLALSSMYKPSFISILFELIKIWLRQATIMKNGYREITQQIRRVGLWFFGSALPLRLIAIYLYTKFYLNANSSFKVIFRTRYQAEEQTDRQSGDYMLPPLWTIKIGVKIVVTGDIRLLKNVYKYVNL